MKARNDGFLKSVEGNSTIYIPAIFQHAPMYTKAGH